MARPAKPWYRKSNDAWYVTHHGKQIRLAKGKASRKEAYREFLKLTERCDPSTAARSSAEAICEMFLDHARVHNKPNTVSGYERFVEPFAEMVKGLDGNAVLPRHVSGYLNAHIDWNKTTRYNAITAIKRAWSWALEEGHITVNQLKPMKRPRPERREDIPDDRAISAFVAAANPLFREVLRFMRETGCRPGEAYMVERRHVDLENREVRFKIGEDKTSGKTGKPRVINLNDAAFAQLTRLIAEYPSGPLFRNSRGGAWTRHAVNCAVIKARKKAGLGDDLMVAYAMRHQYITDGLARGVPIAVIAEMCGTSPEMIAKVYSHISEKKALFMQAANLIRPA